jgi:hypothetical protein
MKFRIRPRTFRLPQIKSVFRLPGIKLVQIRLPFVGWKLPIPHLPVVGRRPLQSIGIAVGISALLITGAIFFAISGVNQAPSWPGPGVYVGESNVGQDAPRALPGSLDLTLPARTNQLILENLEIGKDAGLTNVFEIGTPNTGDYIYISVMTADGMVCPRFIISTSDISTASFTDNQADGHAFTILGGNPDDIHVGIRGARSRSATSTSYDKIIIRGNGANAQINTLIVKNVRAFGGACDFSNLRIGSLYVVNSIVGTGDGINNNDFGFGQSVTVGTFIGVNNQEVEVSVR